MGKALIRKARKIDHLDLHRNHPISFSSSYLDDSLLGIRIGAIGVDIGYGMS